MLTTTCKKNEHETTLHEHEYAAKNHAHTRTHSTWDTCDARACRLPRSRTSKCWASICACTTTQYTYKTSFDLVRTNFDNAHTPPLDIHTIARTSQHTHTHTWRWCTALRRIGIFSPQNARKMSMKPHFMLMRMSQKTTRTHAHTAPGTLVTHELAEGPGVGQPSAGQASVPAQKHKKSNLEGSKHNDARASTL